MQEAWITLFCPACTESWEVRPSEFDGPGVSITCRHCGSTHPIAEFCKTARDFRILKELTA